VRACVYGGEMGVCTQRVCVHSREMGGVLHDSDRQSEQIRGFRKQYIVSASRAS